MYAYLHFLRSCRRQRHCIAVLPLFPRPDLRTLGKPIEDRLSSDFAGQSVNDERDIEIIRDEWFRRTLNDRAGEYSKRDAIR